MSLILASNSQIRRTMLEQAGLQFEVRSPDFDETPSSRNMTATAKASRGCLPREKPSVAVPPMIG